MPEFDIDASLTSAVNPFNCPVCASELHVVRRYVEEDYAAVNEQGEVRGPREFEITEYIYTGVLCSRDDDHELALSEDQTAALLEKFERL